MAGESVEAKALRLLAGGRLFVERVDEGGVRAVCRGDHGIHELSIDEEGSSCSCAARGRCSHLLALELATGRSSAGAST